MNKSILLIEDNSDDEVLTLLAFRQNNFSNKVIVAGDGVEALDYLFGTGRHEGRDLTDMPALILLDLKLPRISGIEVLRRIRSDPRTHRLPVVVLTSSTEEQDLIACYDLGCNSYVRKPVNFSEFVKTAQQLGLYWLLLNENPPPNHLPPADQAEV